MLKDNYAFSGFSVDNLEKAKSFYSEILGLKITENPMGILELHTSGNNPIIIYPKTDHSPATFTVLNFVVKDIQEAVDELIDKSITFEQYERDMKTDEKGIYWSPDNSPGGPNIAWFKDPAGNILSVIEDN